MNSPFSAIYVEDAARPYEMTTRLLERYPSVPVISVRRYRDVFARPKQEFSWQKKNQALILAVKEPPFLYPGPDVCQSFGADSFVYTPFLMNCPFACDYCYLQGMYPSAHLTAFVNIEDYKQEIARHLDANRGSSTLIAASYDTDLLAFDAVFPYLDLLYPFLKEQSDLLFEVRTKSADTRFFERHSGDPGPFVAAFSLAPEAVIRTYERKTPSLDKRIEAVLRTLDAGFPVRLCLDPVLIDPRFDDEYEPFFRYIFSKIPAERILDISHGFFRMSRTFFRRIRHDRPDVDLFQNEYPIQQEVVTYEETAQQQIRNRHHCILAEYISKERIFLL